MAKSIRRAMNELPESGITVSVLKALDFVVPGEWKNTVGFEPMIAEVSGETDPTRIRAIGVKANEIYRDPDTGYQKALGIYHKIDTADAALGAAAMANKVGERFSFLSFLSRLTPKADTTQTLDLALKVVAELTAYCQINGLPRDMASIRDFSSALAVKYRGESLMRMATLVCVDGIIPLGPDFTRKSVSVLGNLTPSQLQGNTMYKRVSEMIPGGSAGGQISFINETFESVQNWMNNLVQSRNLTTETVTSKLSTTIEFADSKLDYLAAFLDMSTNYYTHTGTQSVAHDLIQRATQEV